MDSDGLPIVGPAIDLTKVVVIILRPLLINCLRVVNLESN